MLPRTVEMCYKLSLLQFVSLEMYSTSMPHFKMQLDAIAPAKQASTQASTRAIPSEVLQLNIKNGS